MFFVLAHFPPFTVSFNLLSYNTLSAFACLSDLSCRTIKLQVTFLVEEMSRNGAAKTRTISGNVILDTLPRDVREVSSFEAKKRTVAHQLDSRWAI